MLDCCLFICFFIVIIAILLVDHESKNNLLTLFSLYVSRIFLFYFPASWFEVTQDKNTNVYVSGLPLDMTDDDFKELMNKCGLIMFDPLTKKAKLKLYKDENGQNKGDGRCCYIKVSEICL